ncbi:Kyphoscoliosis peptidase [Psilocybe cubensis]|uniref:Kyphoscoliosis peptidase n=2 Tax=Psilocybe cubensis TaxID=181762 RepID=A0ACB8HC30_PSICU|nr:Kyphoscoliosis peptidase [Psilocybe cubensis]KAH9485416.1 Kyphoscoliosis peptidase [Psilocybe cubensis]
MFHPAPAPPVPPRGGMRSPITPVFNVPHKTPCDDNSVDLSRLLARKPPPPPVRSKNFVPATQIVTHIRPVAFHPPPLNLSSKPVVVEEDPVQIVATPYPEIPSCLQCRDFSKVDAHAALFPRTSVHSLQNLALGLEEPFEDEVDKARVIFTWLHCNIAYDAVSFLTGNVQPSTPESTLASGLAVCEGYAGLFEQLGELMGLQVHTVSGHGKGYSYQPLKAGDAIPEKSSGHAWNCILLNGEWHLVDPCWGAGVLTGSGTYEAKFSPHWFISSPSEFGRTHFPTDPSFQLTPEQTTWEEYILAPETPVITSDFHLYGYHPMFLQPSEKHVPERQFVQFSVSKRCQHASMAVADNYLLVISTNDKDFVPLAFSEELDAWTVNIFTPRNGDITLYIVNSVNAQDARGLSIEGFGKAKGRKVMGFKGLAMWSVAHL